MKKSKINKIVIFTQPGQRRGTINSLFKTYRRAGAVS